MGFLCANIGSNNVGNNSMNQTVNFIHHCEFDTLPEAVVAQTLRCLLDLVGVAAGGMTTPAANIMCEHVTQQYLSASQGRVFYLMGVGLVHRAPLWRGHCHR